MQKNRNKKEVFSAGYLYHTNFGTFEVFRQISRIYYGSLEIYYGIESNGECSFIHVNNLNEPIGCVLSAVNKLLKWCNSIILHTSREVCLYIR